MLVFVLWSLKTQIYWPKHSDELSCLCLAREFCETDFAGRWVWVSNENQGQNPFSCSVNSKFFIQHFCVYLQFIYSHTVSFFGCCGSCFFYVARCYSMTSLIFVLFVLSAVVYSVQIKSTALYCIQMLSPHFCFTVNSLVLWVLCIVLFINSQQNVHQVKILCT